MKAKVIVQFNSEMAHFSQVFAGLELLKEDGLIDLEYSLHLGSIPFNKLCLLYREKKVIFDLADDHFLDDLLLQESDFYVKRMLLKSEDDLQGKVIPFGLNYSVMSKNEFFSKLWLKKFSFISYSLKYNYFFSRILGLNDSIFNVHLDNMHRKPINSDLIILRTRLWDPKRNEIDWKKAERQFLNLQRISIIRNLRSVYKNRFLGGVESSSLSKIICPDLLLLKKEAKKSNYLASLKTGGIGVANYGLEGSVGWKFAEYISHSLAVVSTPIKEYRFDHELVEGQNYLEFNDLDDCLNKIEWLMSNPVDRMEMQKENYQYYTKYLHPKEKIKNIFKLIDDSIS